MSIYFFTFALSALLCMMGEYYSKVNKNRISRVFFILSVLVVSVLAGVRDLEIGTDIWTYGEYSFIAARKSSNLFYYLKENAVLDPVYNVLTFLVSRFTDNSHWLYFFIGVFIYSFTMLGILNYKDRISITLAWLCFLFLYYGDTFNAMRQFMGVALAFYGMKYAFEGHYKKYLIVTVLAFLSHDTAIISFAIFAVLLVLKKSNKMGTKLLIVMVVMACCFLYSYITGFLIRFGLIDAKYSRYMSSGLSLDLNPLILRLPFFLCILLYYNSFCNGERNGSLRKLSYSYEGDFLVIMLILDMIISQMRSMVPALYRLSYLFGMYRIVAYSRVATAVKKDNRIIIRTVFIVYLVVLWIYQNVLQGNNDIYPFTSKLLGIY